jgi:predicted nucleic acid-binding protein
MSDLVVVDASVALKWVVREPGSEAAAELLDRSVGDAVTLVAPEHLVGELGNGLRERVAQGVLAADDALAAFESVAELGLELVAGAERWWRAPSAAMDWGVTTYDALYVLIALDLDAELVTADQRLTDAGHAKSLPVRSLTVSR